MQENFKVFSNVREVNLMRIKKAKENGRKVVGVFCAYCPLELTKTSSLPALESDYSTSDLETLKVRIEAMLEMVDK